MSVEGRSSFMSPDVAAMIGGGRWSYSTLEVVPDRSDARIDLRAAGKR